MTLRRPAKAITKVTNTGLARDLPEPALQVTAPRHTCRSEILSSLRLLVPGALGCQSDARLSYIRSDARLSYIRLPSDLVEVGHAGPRRQHPASVQASAAMPTCIQQILGCD